MKFRTLNKLYANLFGYFWLPCPSCSKCFGGHEWGYTNGMPSAIDGKGICQDCADAGKGNYPTFTLPDGILAQLQRTETR